MKRPSGGRWLFVGSLLLFTYVFVVNAWIADDAYISFRTVDNFVQGHGLRWNVVERVQAYSHPLWVLALSAFSALTGDVFYTSIALSFLLCLGCVAVLFRRFQNAGQAFKAPLLVLLLVACKGFIDFTTSGLENPLSYFLATLFFSVFLFRDRLGANEILSLFCVASLAFVNRADTILLYAPSLVALGRSAWGEDRSRFLRWLPMAVAPALAWIVFSTLYYGTPLPNTAYAKMIAPGVPVLDRLRRGLAYFVNSLAHDVASYVLLGVAIYWSSRQRSRRTALVVAGILLYLLYVVLVGATATHMTGRFFALPLFAALVVFVALVPDERRGLAAAAIASVFLLLSPTSSLKMHTGFYEPLVLFRYFDMKIVAHRQGAALIGLVRGRTPGHGWLREGRAFRDTSAKIHVGGADETGAVGYFGYAAGADKIVLDHLGLTDPLLARLPACNVSSREYWIPGHFLRWIPDGYVSSLAEGENRLTDPSLRLYYEKIRSLTRDPLLKRERLGTILAMAFGSFDELLEPYRRDIYRRFGSSDCTGAVRATLGPVTSP